ncbi:MAG: zinc-ribbon domain-containing protein [Peptostreptococcaceae bacterium]
MSNKETIFCSQCGQEVLKSSKFCSQCGHSLKSIEDSIKDKAYNIKDSITNSETYQNFTNINGDDSIKADWDNDDMINFIQKNTEFYIPKFKDMQEFDKNTSWNWGAFFFTSNWMFYRKMYGYGVGLILANIVLAFIPFVGWLLNLATYAVCGLYGNTLYLKHIQKQLQSVDGLREDVRHRSILSKGGTNLVLPLILMFGVPLLVFILTFFGLAFSFMSMPFYY